MIRAHIKSLVLAGGISVELAEDAIVVIIGPNNTGKSTSLVEVRRAVAGEQFPRRIIESVEVVRDYSVDKVIASLKRYRNAEGIYNLSGGRWTEQAIRKLWETPNTAIGFLATYVVSELTTGARLSDCNPAPSFDTANASAAVHPFQRMYIDDKLEMAASSVVRQAFKIDLVVHRAAGNTIPVYVGNRPLVQAGEDRISRSYLEKVESLDRLEAQGDGIRSFVSIVSRIYAEGRSMLLIDEPEAFLHPPQARMIAETISDSPFPRQTIIATHSSEVLQGVLAKFSKRVSVIRLTRRGGAASATHLSAAEIADLWKDPILRFGNVLAGLFHDAVVLTESDADCKFYESFFRIVATDDQQLDVHYTYSGGKDRMATLVSALRNVGVPVATIVDFDILNNDQPLRKIVAAHGGDWTKFENTWRAVKTAVENRDTFLSGDRFRTEILEQLDKYGDGTVVPKEVLRQVAKLTRRASPWDNIKDSGINAISAGQPTVEANSLLLRLKEIGIFVAPLGELEGFCRSIGGHGPRWVESVLNRDIANDAELRSARDFTKEVADYLVSRTN